MYLDRKAIHLEVRQKLGDILNGVALGHDQFIIERGGKPLAAVMPVEQFEQMQRAACLHLRRVLKEQSGALLQEEAAPVADEVKRRTRRSPRK